jgi:hypothetical protein
MKEDGPARLPSMGHHDCEGYLYAQTFQILHTVIPSASLISPSSPYAIGG